MTSSPFLAVVPGLLSGAECSAVVEALARLQPTRQAGRQGTGYDKADLWGVDDAVINDVRARMVALLSSPPACDVWWLEYPVGSQIPPHTDPSPADGLAHVRINVVVARAAADHGGYFVADGVTVPLAVGDAVLFRPDIVEHAVTAVTGAPRRVLSVGTVLPPEAASALVAAVSGALRR